MNIKVANGIKALSRKELEECFVKSLHNEHEAIHRANKLEEENQQLKEQRQELRSWLEERVFYLNSVFDRDIYEEQMMLDFSNILIKLNELEGGKNEKIINE